MIESKHRIIRDVFLRLKAESKNDPPVSSSILVKQAIRITNNLYGNDVASAHELAKGYPRPVLNGSIPMKCPKEFLETHENLKAQRKLTHILRSKSVQDKEFSPGPFVHVFIKKCNEKRGKCPSDKLVLAYNHESRTATGPGSNGKRIKAAVEDVRVALPSDSLSREVQDSIDLLDRGI